MHYKGGCDFLLERRSENYKLEDLICARPPARLSPYMISLDSWCEAGTVIHLNSQSFILKLREGSDLSKVIGHSTANHVSNLGRKAHAVSPTRLQNWIGLWYCRNQRALGATLSEPRETTAIIGLWPQPVSAVNGIVEGRQRAGMEGRKGRVETDKRPTLGGRLEVEQMADGLEPNPARLHLPNPDAQEPRVPEPCSLCI